MKQREIRLCILCAIATALMAALLALSESSAEGREAPGPVSFLHDVAPILKENCLACHDAKKKSGKLVMASYASLRKGGTNDDPIVPGKPEESELMTVLTTDGERQMPPRDKGGPLPAEKIRLIEEWIRQGAKLDEDVEANADLLRELRKHWQPPLPPDTYRSPPPMAALAISADGQQIVTGGYYELLIWQTSNGQLAKRVRTRTERVYGMAFVSDQLLAVAGGRPGQEGDVRIYDLNATGTTKDGVVRLDGVGDPKVLVAHLFDTDDCVMDLALSPDGKLLAAGGCDRMARVWDLSAGITSIKLVATVATHADWVLGVGFSADSRFLLTAGRDKSAKSFDLSAQSAVANFVEHQSIVHGVAGHGANVAYSVGGDKALRLWKVDSGGKSIKTATGHTGEITRVLAHPRLPLVYTASMDGTIRVWKDDGTPVRTIRDLPDSPLAIAINADGQFLAAVGAQGEVRLWNAETGKSVAGFAAYPRKTQSAAR